MTNVIENVSNARLNQYVDQPDQEVSKNFMPLMANSSISAANHGQKPVNQEADSCDTEEEGSPYEDMEDTGDELVAIVGLARAAYSAAKDNASWAAAHTYLLWVKTYASDEAKTWFRKQVDERNKKLTANNATLERDPSNAEAMGELSPGEKWMPIKARNGASKFTEVVKYAFDFVQPRQASNVSRYVSVVEWLHSKFEGEVVPDAAYLVKEIIKVGGFETVVRLQRSKDSVSSSRAVTPAANAPTSKYETLKKAKCFQEIEFAAKNVHEGLAVLIGRFVDGKVQIVGELKITKADLDVQVGKLDEMDFQPPVEMAIAV